MSRKINTSAKLKTLPAPVQEQLFALYGKSSGAACLAWLKEKHGVSSSAGALSEFHSWFPFSRPLERVRDYAKTFEAQLKANPKLRLDAEQLSIAGQIAFETEALRLQDWEAFVSLRKVRLKEEEQQTAKSLLALKVRQYEDKMATVKAKLEGLTKKGGLSAATLRQIEEAAAIL